MTVRVLDANNNVVTTDSSTQVTLAIGTNPGSGTLSGTLQQTAASGTATFAGISIDKTGTGYKLAASDTTGTGGIHPITGATSSAFNITPGTATHLAFNVQPANAVAGVAISPSVTVQVLDANNNVVTTDSSTKVTLAIGTNPGSGTLSGTLQRTAASGTATFAGLSINKTGTGYTLAASDTTGTGGIHPLTGGTSSTFNITPGTATKLVYTQQPTTAAAGVAIAPPLTVAVEDANGNVVTTDNATKVTLAIGTNPNTGTLTGGGQVTVVSGVATFAAVSINNVGTGYTLTASDTTGAGGGHPYTAATSTAFNITSSLAGIDWTNAVLSGGGTFACVKTTLTAITCTATSVGNKGTFTANVRLVDSSDADSNNSTGATVTIAQTTTGSGSSSPASVTILNGASTSAATFTTTLSAGNSTATITASVTVAGTTYTVNCVVSR